ncbi:MAG TPA: hypothetical protein VJ933_01320 [Phaeodactylibacter sp.]|nr:hypothetical protein [Phaeodactylibacter sp.]
MNRVWLIACLLLGLAACEAEGPTQTASHPLATEEDTFPQAAPPAIAQPFAGIIIVGGRYFLGDTATIALDEGFIELDRPLRNAAIKGEPLRGLLKRLPYLLAQQPQAVVVELGQEDELARTRLPAFKRSLRRLARLLEDSNWVLLSTATQADLANTITTFAESRGISLVSIDPGTTAPRAAARRIVPVLAK